MSYYASMAAQLQSRLARRASQISLNVLWRDGYRALKRVKDLRETKALLRELDKQQKLDTQLLKLVQHEIRNELFYYELKSF
jgi:hypothetical protein